MSLCRFGTAEAIEEMVKEKKFNIRRVKGTKHSPFSYAIINGNTEGALAFLKHDHYIADLSGLCLATIPAGLTQFNVISAIKELDLSNNSLNFLPAQLAQVERVNVVGNPLLCFPPKLRTAKWSK